MWNKSMNKEAGRRLKKCLTAGIGVFCIAGLSGCTNDIGEEAAKRTALDDTCVTESVVSDMEVKQDRNNGRKMYTVSFEFEGNEYTYEILAADGTVINMEQEPKPEMLETLQYIKQYEEEIVRLRDELIQRKQELEILMAETQNEEEAERLRVNMKEAEDEIDILNQRIENWEEYAAEQNEKQQKLSEKQLEELVLQRVPGAEKDTLTMEKKTEGGYDIYSGTINYEKKYYEFEIDAETGMVLYWCMELEE